MAVACLGSSQESGRHVIVWASVGSALGYRKNTCCLKYMEWFIAKRNLNLNLLDRRAQSRLKFHEGYNDICACPNVRSQGLSAVCECVCVWLPAAPR